MIEFVPEITLPDTVRAPPTEAVPVVCKLPPVIAPPVIALVPASMTPVLVSPAKLLDAVVVNDDAVIDPDTVTLLIVDVPFTVSEENVAEPPDTLFVPALMACPLTLNTPVVAGS